MSTIVYRISVLLGAILVDVPVGTNLGLFWLLWALLSGRFLLSRGAIFPALADSRPAAMSCPRPKAGGVAQRMGNGSAPYPRTHSGGAGAALPPCGRPQ